MRKLALMLIACCVFLTQLWAQNKTVTGKVTNDGGSPVGGASVTVKGTRIGTVTSQDGTFSISVPTGATTLTISFAGYNPTDVSISNRNTVLVTLTTGSNALGDVVVTGIRNIRRAEFTGAVSRLDSSNIANRPVGSFDQLLQGQVPGLLAVTGSGQPGTAATVIIRGQGSISGGSNPLYIVDGIPVEASTFQGINANDILTLDVLKDATSAALYGSRGSSGVIVVTTKRGTGRKMKLSYDAQMGIKNKPEFAFRPMTTPELLKAQEDYGRMLGTIGTATLPGWFYSRNNPRYALLNPTQQANANAIYDSISNINTDWADYIFRNGSFSNHQISLAGGTGKTRVYSSLALYNEDGITPRTDMQRVSFRNNVDYSDDKLTFSLSSTVAYTKRSFQQSSAFNTSNPFASLNLANPYTPVFKADGTYNTGVGTSYVATNQLDLTYYDRNYNNQIKTVFGLNTAYKITNDITAAVVAGIDFRETQATVYGSRLAFQRRTSSTPTTNAGSQSESLNRFFSGNVRPSISYAKVFASKHSVSASIYGEYIKELSKATNGTGYGIDPRTPNTPAAIRQGDGQNLLFAVVGGSKSQNALLSGLAIATYTYDDKYSFTGSYRNDGSSRLPSSNRWTSFFSIGGVWTVSKENFLADNRTINSLRLRANYGSSGNSNNFPFGDFGYLPQYVASGSYAGLSTLAISNIGNLNLKWETIYQLNVGVDFSILRNRVYGSFDVYNKTTKNLFVQQRLSAEAGGYTPDRNAGELSNKGIEADLSVDVVKTKDLVWTINGKVGYNKNRLTSLGGNPPYTDGTELYTEGVSLGSHYAIKWAGVDAATGIPLYYKSDGTLTTTVNTVDYVQQFGTWEAPWKGGFGTNLRYKDFSLSTLFSFQQGNTKVDNLEYFVENPQGFLAFGYNQSSSLKFWQKPGDIVSVPNPVYGVADLSSSKYIHDASFLRLRDVTISYTLPQNIIKKTRIFSNVRLYAQGTNLFIWTKWRGMDPEAGAVNLNISEFPNPRAFTGGLSVTF